MSKDIKCRKLANSHKANPKREGFQRDSTGATLYNTAA